MIHIVVLAHGGLAKELLRSLEMIIGTSPALYSVSLDPSENLDDYEKRVREVIDIAADDPEKTGVLILADMFGGSCANIGAKVAADEGPKDITVITGVNLPMLLDAVINRDILNFDGLKAKTIEAGTRSVMDMTDLIKKRVRT